MSKDMVMLVPISFGILVALGLVSAATLGMVDYSNMGSWIVTLMGGTGVLTVICLWIMLADGSDDSWKPPERIHTHTERTSIHVVRPEDFGDYWQRERHRN